MKFTYKDVQTKIDDEGKAKLVETEYHFLRTLDTETKFRDETGQELNAQLAEILQTIMNMEKDNPSIEDMMRMTSLDNIDAIHQVLKFMYAERKGDILVQNETTREHYEALDLYEKGVISQYFRSI